jgi:predicted aspartyl protease
MLKASHCVIILSLFPGYLLAEPLLYDGAKIPIYDKGAATYYVPARVNEQTETEFMVDTGSGYTTINDKTLSEIGKTGRTEYIESVVGIMADGSEISMPIYRIASLNIGGNCIIHNVEVAVLPGETRNILGLSALKMVAPFSLFVDPPAIALSNCEAARDVQGSETAASL